MNFKNMYFGHLIKNKIPKSVYHLVGRFSIGIGQLIFLKVLTSTLNPEEIGKYYLIMSILALNGLIVFSPIYSYISRSYYGWYSSGLGWLVFKQLIKITLYIALIATALVFILHFFLKINEIVYFLPGLIFVTVISSYPQELINIMGRFRTYIILNNLELWGRISFIFISGTIFQPNAKTIFSGIIVWGVIISVIISFLILRLSKDFYLNKSIYSEFKGIAIGDIINFGWPYAISLSLYWCQTDGYRFVANHVSDLENVGKFIVGFGFGVSIMTIIESLVQQMYLPKFYKEISNESIFDITIAWEKYAKIITSVFIPLGLCTATITPYLIRWALGSNYWDVSLYASLGIVSQVFRIFSGATTLGLAARKKTKRLIFPSLAGALIALIGTYFFSSQTSLIGAAASLIVSHLITLIFLCHMLTKELPVKFPYGNIIKVLKLCTPMFVSLIILSTFNFHTITYLNILVLIIVAFWYIYSQWVLSKELWFSS